MLILVRHGKAEPRHVGIDDASRPLTPEGRRAIQGSYPHTFSQLDDYDVRIWSSPYRRAFQTADIIAESVGDGCVSGHYSLARDSIDEFLAELAACDAPAVIAVGHNPFIEVACERLTGLPLAFVPGTAAAIAIDIDKLSDANSDSEPCGELLWFVKGPDWNRWRTLQRTSDFVARAVADYETSVSSVFTDRPDAQLLDRVRGSIAEVRALLTFIRPFARERRLAELIDYLDDTAVEFERLHAYDVLCQEIASGRSSRTPYLSGRLGMGLDSTPTPLSLEEELTAPDPQPTLYEHACGTREEAWERLARLYRTKKESKRFSAFVEKAGHVKWRQRIEEGGLSEAMLCNRYQSLADQLRNEWALVRFGDRKAVDRLRDDVRRLQVVADRLAPIVSQDLCALSERLQESYSDLIELCDIRAMRMIIAHWDAADLHGEATYQLVSLNARLLDRENKIVSRLEIARA